MIHGRLIFRVGNKCSSYQPMYGYVFIFVVLPKHYFSVVSVLTYGRIRV